MSDYDRPFGYDPGWSNPSESWMDAFPRRDDGDDSGDIDPDYDDETDEEIEDEDD